MCLHGSFSCELYFQFEVLCSMHHYELLLTIGVTLHTNYCFKYTYLPLLTMYWSMLTTTYHYSLLATHSSLLTAHSSLLTTHYLPLVIALSVIALSCAAISKEQMYSSMATGSVNSPTLGLPS